MESGNAPGALLQTSALVLHKISGPMAARFLSSTGLQCATLVERAQPLAAPALDKIVLPFSPLLSYFFATLGVKGKNLGHRKGRTCAHKKKSWKISCQTSAGFKTFISCYRTPRPWKGFRRVSEGVSERSLEGSLKGFKKVLEGVLAEDPF